MSASTSSVQHNFRSGYYYDTATLENIPRVNEWEKIETSDAGGNKVTYERKINDPNGLFFLAYGYGTRT
jgi:hypothetical protein